MPPRPITPSTLYFPIFVGWDAILRFGQTFPGEEFPQKLSRYKLPRKGKDSIRMRLGPTFRKRFAQPYMLCVAACEKTCRLYGIEQADKRTRFPGQATRRKESCGEGNGCTIPRAGITNSGFLLS